MIALLALWANSAFCSDVSGWRAEVLEDACSATYSLSPSVGVVGKRTEGPLAKNRVYEHLDYWFGGLVFVATDSNGNLDPRPLGSGSIIECRSANPSLSPEDPSMCELRGGEFVPLKKDDPRAASRLIHRLVSRPDWTQKNAFDAIQWETSVDSPMELRDPKAVVPTDPGKSKAAGRNVVVPGKSVPRFYRKDSEYWKHINGKLFAVDKGHWMQFFKDGAFHQVKSGYHLEEWPGEPDIMVEVKDTEEWVKLGKDPKAYVFVEKFVRPATDWSKFYLKGGSAPPNSSVSAAGGCRPCTGNADETVPIVVEPNKE